MEIKPALAIVGFELLIAGGLLLSEKRAHGNGTGPTELPHAEGMTFENLDAYLAHLQELGAIGITWYEQMPDGRYQMIRRRPPGQPPELFTRQELLERFGFRD